MNSTETYTADADSLIAYLTDGLTGEADSLYEMAETGKVLIRTPSHALTEALNLAPTFEGIKLSASMQEANESLGNSPIITDTAPDTLSESFQVSNEYSVPHKASPVELVWSQNSVVGYSD